jgi:rare lipoprotein A
MLKTKANFVSESLLLLAVASLFLMQACASAPQPVDQPPPVSEGHPKPYRVYGKWYRPLPDAMGFSQEGIASWYGKKFHGRKTSNGETYDMYKMTAAHKTLPLGTWVQVQHLASGKQIKVRVNDRGPFVQGRIIDLSYAAAKELGIVGPGTASVRVVALGEKHTSDSGDTYTPMDYYHGSFTFQVGAFSDRNNAERLRAKLDRHYTNAHIAPYNRGDRVFYRVRVGRCSDLGSAEKLENDLIGNGYPQAFIVAE